MVDDGSREAGEVLQKEPKPVLVESGVARFLEVEPLPPGRQRAGERGFSALPKANDGNARKIREILRQKWLAGSLHA